MVDDTLEPKELTPVGLTGPSQHVSISKRVEQENEARSPGVQYFVGLVIVLVVVAVVAMAVLLQPEPKVTYSEIVIDKIAPGLPPGESNNTSALVSVYLRLANQGDAESGNLSVEILAFDNSGKTEFLRGFKNVNLTALKPGETQPIYDLNITVFPGSYRFEITIYEVHEGTKQKIEQGDTFLSISSQTIEEEGEGYVPNYDQNLPQDDSDEAGGAFDAPAPGLVPALAGLAGVGLLKGRQARRRS